MLPFAMSLLLILAGAGLTMAFARLIRGGAAVTAILFVSYALRVALAIALYVISAWRLPILSDLHMEDGFWRFSRDAQAYHWLGIAIADSLRWGTELPNVVPFGDPDFVIILGFLYRAIGAHPLYMPLLNAALCTGILSLVYWLARSLNGERAGVVAVAIVAVWPSFYLWSAQILKDSLAIVLILAILALIMVALERRLRLVATSGLLATLIPLALLLGRIRFYLILSMVAGLCCVVVLRLIAPADRGRRLRMAMLGAAYAAVLLACVVVGQGTDPIAVIQPAEPRAGHVRKAQYLEARGDTAGAIFEYGRASGHVPPPLITLSARDILNPRFPAGTTTTLSQLSLAEVKAAALVAVRLGKSADGPGDVSAQASTPTSSPPEPNTVTAVLFSIGLGVEKVTSRFEIARIVKMQRGFLQTYSGYALPNATLTGLELVSGVSDLLLQLPRAMAAALWTPFPWQWFVSGQDTGAARYLATIEMIMLALLTPWLLLGIWRGLRARRSGAWLLIGYSLATAVALGSIIANIGILFRLRLQFLFPLMIIVAAYGASNSKLVARLASFLSRRPIESPSTDLTASPRSSV